MKWDTIVRVAFLAIAAFSCVPSLTKPAWANFDSYSIALPRTLQGPFVSDVNVTKLLDCNGEQICAGPMSFSRLIQGRVQKSDPAAAPANPFELSILRRVRETVASDLNQIRKAGNAIAGQLDAEFLRLAGSRVELVGVVNRMDRQFVKRPSQRKTIEQMNCGEISLIFRFAYTLPNGQGSRLPVTMNLVFPALPTDTQGGKITCSDIARRWLDETSRSPDQTAESTAADLLDPNKGALAYISGRDIERLELNMQAYRNPASSAKDFGTKAEYLLRVFEWSEQDQQFIPALMTNQVDRNLVLCAGDDTNCQEKRARRSALVAYLQDPATVADLDNGLLDIPQELGVLAARATSLSPGGSHRSMNQPYWRASSAHHPKPDQEVITDEEIAEAIRRAKQSGVHFSFIKSASDFRTRLNDSTCTGCHQTRAIAGFHFPGPDRRETEPANAVLLPGSPHFYGDQIRRIEILKAMAVPSANLPRHQLATSYAARPMNKFAGQLAGTQLLGGWGGACLIPSEKATSQRQWNCQAGFACQQLFDSSSDPSVGTCVPQKGVVTTNEGMTLRGVEVGDALQLGEVETSAYGHDVYSRTWPRNAKLSDTRIPAKVFPSPAPEQNSYYGAHQEFYLGKVNDPKATKEERRDALTGGFPAGMLRLSECQNLPAEASCGLVASSGFNNCIASVGKTLTINDCFATFTSFAGLRACDATRPCRDDYICVRPIGYTAANIDEKYARRRATIEANSDLYKQHAEREYDENDFGQKKPDAAWIERNDARGLCIPPYFVFQFRSDKHPKR